MVVRGQPGEAMAGKPDIAASQAVDELNRQVAALALENARLSGELQQCTDDLQQSREYQAAVGEVLTAISRSTVDLAPILQTLTDTALSLCEAEMGFICRRDGEAIIVVTAAGATPEIASDAEDYRRYQAARPYAIDRGSLAGRVALAGEPVQIPDIAADPEYTLAGATALGKIRTQVGVPLICEGALVGVLILSRQEGRAVLPSGRSSLLQHLRRSGGDRDGERAADHRDARGAGAADRDRRGVAGHQFLARRPRAGVRCDAGKGDAALRRGVRHLWTVRWRAFPRRRAPRRAAGAIAERWRAAAAPGPAIGTVVAATASAASISRMPRRELSPSATIRSTRLVDLGGARTVLACRCARTARCSAASSSIARKSGRSPTSRSRCCRTSPRRR